MTETPSPFLKNSNVQFALDGTSLGYAQECLRKYKYTILDGWRQREESVHFRFGGELARWLEFYHKCRAQNNDHEASLEETVGWMMASTYDWHSNNPKKNRETLVRSVIWYLENYKDDPAKVLMLSNGMPAVELSFKIELPWKAAPDQNYIYCGHMDKIVDYAGDPFVMDQKAQPKYAKVLAEEGWKQIGDLHEGDLICGRDGNFHEIKKLFPKGITPVYKITFNDHTWTTCAEDHLWRVGSSHHFGQRILTLKQMMDAPSYVKFCVPLVAPIQFPKKEYPLHPYLLGVLLGDGYLAGNSIQLSTTKTWLKDKVESLLPKEDCIKKNSEFNNSWTISKSVGRGSSTLKAIKTLGLYKKLAADKFIPDNYMFGSEEQRRDLLKGLLDTDGCFFRRQVYFDSMSHTLAKGVCDLVLSLGGNAWIRERSEGAFRATLRLPEFDTGIKRRYITAIERIEDSETVCIEIAEKDGLYVTDNYIVTHNTTSGGIGPYYFNDFNPSTQMTGYSVAGRTIFNIPVVGVIIDVIKVVGGFTEFGRGFTMRTEAQLDEWVEDLKRWTEIIKFAAERDYWPHNPASCHKYGGCAFREVCNKDPAVRQNYLETLFQKTVAWNPLQSR